MPEYKLDFPVSVGSAAPVRSLSDAVREVADRTKLGEGNLRLFSGMLSETAQRTGSLKTALAELASKQNLFQDFAKSVQSYARETEKAQNETQKLGRTMEQAYAEAAKRAKDAQNETQKLGRMMEQAYAENAKRGQKEVQQLGKDLQNLSRAIPGSGGMLGSGLAGLFGAGGGGAAALGAGAAGLIALLTGAGVAMVKLANETGEYAREQQNLSSRTGLTLRETQEYSQMAQVAGVNVGSLTTAMRALSKGMSDNSEEGKQAKSALKELGLDASVAFEPTGRAMKDIFERLGQVGSGLERDRLAIELFGRGGLELLPLVEQFKELEARVKNAGNVMDEAGIQKAAEYQRQVTLLGQSWDQLKRTMGEKAIGIIQLTMGGRDISIGGIADFLFTGGAVGAAQNFLTSPGRPSASGLAPGLPDPYALMKQGRSEQLASLEASTGTPRQQIEAQMKQAEAQRQAIGSRFVESGKPEDLQKIKDLDKSIASLQGRLDGLKKTAVSFSEELARYANKGETNEFSRRISENREQATALERQFPTHRAAIEGQEYSNLGQLNTEATADIAKFQAHLQSEGEEAAEKFYAEQIKLLAGGEKEQRDKTLQFRTGTGLTIEDYAQLYKTGKPAFAEQIKGVSYTATQQSEALQLSQAQESGVMGRRKASGQYTQQQLAQMDLDDQLAFIQKQKQIQVGEYSTQAQMYNQRAGNEFGTEKQELLDKATEAEAKAKEAETKATIEAVEAVNKFQEAAEEASAKIREQYSSFASGLVAAARQGHAGSYAQNAMLGQFDKMVGNFASGTYMPGMLQFPGQGTAQNPTMLGKLFQGTMFGVDPKAHGNDALASVTDLNTKATADNTTVMAAVYQAMGGDPSSLGLTNLPAMPTLTGGASSAALPFLGNAGAAGAAGGVTAAGSMLKAFGISVPGLTSGGTSTSPISGSGWSFANAGQVSPAFSSGPPSLDFSSLSTSSGPYSLSALSGGGDNTDLSSLPVTMPQSDQSIIGSLGNVSYTPSSLSSDIGMGTAAAGAAFGAYSAIHDFSQGGGQGITAGIGKLAGVSSAILPLAGVAGPAAPILAGVGMLAGLVSSLMGNPVENRQASINHELFNNQYIAPQAINRTMDISGGYADLNYQGDVRATDLSSIPVLQQAYADPRHGVIVPGTVLSPFGGGGPSSVTHVGNFGSLTTDSGTGGHTVNVTNNVSAIDGDSVAQFFQNNSQALGDGIVTALNKGGSDMANRMRTL
jgi:hypothetical protein